MTHSPTRFLTLLALSAALAAGPARADFMNWTYSTSAVPPGFAATGANNGSGAVQLTPFTNAASGSSVALLAYQTSATGPVSFDPKSSTYALTMTITDTKTKDSGSLTFTGSIGGSLSPSSSSLTNTFAQTQQKLKLDGHTYTVTLPSSMSLGGPLSPQHNIIATVSVTGSGGGGPTTPEPTSLVLGGLGFSAFGLAGWWKRSRRLVRQPA
jgi:hypothetical protein